MPMSAALGADFDAKQYVRIQPRAKISARLAAISIALRLATKFMKYAG
jgi:hypothetical protein